MSSILNKKYHPHIQETDLIVVKAVLEFEKELAIWDQLSFHVTQIAPFYIVDFRKNLTQPQKDLIEKITDNPCFQKDLKGQIEEILKKRIQEKQI